MSGQLRFFAAVALIAGLPTAPASSNPFDFLFNAPAEQAAAPARAEEECLPRPGTSPTDGQRWVYRLDGHRKCWFQVAKEVVTAKKQARPRGAKQIVPTPENGAAMRKRNEVVDARAELLRSASPETAQPTATAPEIKVADAAAVPGTGAASLVSPPVAREPETNELAPNQPMPPHVDVEMLLAAAPVNISVPPSTPPAVPAADAGTDAQEWTASWLGVLLMGLGLVFLLISSLTLRETFAFGANR